MSLLFWVINDEQRPPQPPTKMKALTLLRLTAQAAIASIAITASANETAHVLRIEGKVLSSNPLEGASVTILQDGAAFNRMDKGLAQFQMDLPLGHEYRLKFELPGTIAKELVFDARLPKNVEAKKDFLFHFQVSLLAQPTEGAQQYDGPVGMIAFNAGDKDFGYEHLHTTRLESTKAPGQEAVAQAPVKRVRKEVAAFVDPTMELAAWTEQKRAEHEAEAKN